MIHWLRTLSFVPLTSLFVLGAAAYADEASESPARQQAEKLAALAPLIGDWMPAVGDPVLEDHPELAGQIVTSYRWGPRRMLVRTYEHFPVGRPERAALEGLIYWDHADSAYGFAASTVYGWIFEGSYRALGDGRIERIYEVHYADGERYMPEPQLEGSVRHFREVFSVPGPDRLEMTLEILRDGAWHAFGRGRYRLERHR